MDNIDDLVERLDATDINLNQEAQARLVELGRPIVDRLLTVLQGGTVRQRINAVLVLGKIGDAGTIGALCALSSDPSTAVRVNCASALGLIDDPRVVSCLVEWLGQEKQAFVQSMIIKALADKRDKSSLGPLTDALQRAVDPCVRYMLIRALGELGDPSAIESILPFVNDENHHVRQDARRALGKLGYVSSQEKGKTATTQA